MQQIQLNYLYYMALETSAAEGRMERAVRLIKTKKWTYVTPLVKQQLSITER